MATGIIIHIEVGNDRRTEFFSEERIRIGSDENCDLQIETRQFDSEGLWIELENNDGTYRVVAFDPAAFGVSKIFACNLWQQFTQET